MDFLFDPTIRLLTKAASYRVARQEVVASNLANTETPGYTAKDVPFEAFLSGIESGDSAAPVATHPRHIGAAKRTFDAPPPVVTEGDAARLDGNNVVLEKEMSKMAENAIGYLTDMQLASKKFKGVRYAIDEASRQ
jgi:flagellar basal-body rod protein FlgB